ncbi:hypothetical protein DBR32_02685 [Taibaiella sp. KBW10]|nr:hypothetical protein DBR32_02685 [Taibaiella sp. KBW10]
MILLPIIAFFSHTASGQSRFTSISYNNQHTYIPGTYGFPISIFSYISFPDPAYKAIISWGDGHKSSVSLSQSCFMDVYYYKHPGIYNVSIVLYDKTLNKALDTTQMQVMAFCTHFSSNIFQSNTGSCTYNAATDALIPIPLRFIVKKNGVLIDTFSALGAFKEVVPMADLQAVFSVSPTGIPPGYRLVCPAAGSYTFKFDTLSSANNIFDFKLQPSR